MSRFLMVAVWIGIVAACFCSHVGGQEIIFADDFNRSDADTVGNEWSSKGTAVLKDNALLFLVREEEFRPRVRHSFPVQTEGKFTASFLMDWLRESEGTWGFYMQLGHSEGIPRFLIREHDLAKGMGVNLLWGGGDLLASHAKGSFGYLKDGKFNALFVVNDKQAEKTVVKNPVVTIEVDMDASTYRVIFNGQTYPDIPFDNECPIDTIRFITNGCSKSGFSRSSIDDVMITKGK